MSAAPAAPGPSHSLHPSGDCGGGVCPKYTGGSLAGIFLEGCLELADSGIEPQISLHCPGRFSRGDGGVFGTCRTPEMSLERPLWGHKGGGVHVAIAQYWQGISSGVLQESQGV